VGQAISTKQYLINGIHELIYNNVFCSDPQSRYWSNVAANGYERRFIGYRAELEFRILMDSYKIERLDGGWMLPRKKGKRCLDESSVYFTISSNPHKIYQGIYSLLEKIRFERMFFIEYLPEPEISRWEVEDLYGTGIMIPHPSYRCYEFKRNAFVDVSGGRCNIGALLELYNRKETPYRASYSLNQDPPSFAETMLGTYPLEYLVDILANRFIFDGLLGMNVEKGIPSDIDLIIERNGSLSLVETKEKDISKREPVGFGMDVDRMKDMLAIEERTGLPYYYVVREVNNQVERKFLGWRRIAIRRFYDLTRGYGTIEGGTGMATARNTDHPTLVAPAQHFQIICSPSDLNI